MMSSATHAATSKTRRAASTVPMPEKGKVIAAVILCWLFIVFDGYDLIVYGTVISSLVEEWGISPASAGNIGSTAFFGMIFGALVAGPLSDRLGRKSVALWCVIVFSLFTALCGIADGPLLFSFSRLIAGIGLGGIIVVANALASDIVSDRMRPVVATILMSGVPIGGCLAALAGIPTIPTLGWRAMFLYALVPLIVLVPLGIKILPSTPASTAATMETNSASPPPPQTRGIRCPVPAPPHWDEHSLPLPGL